MSYFYLTVPRCSMQECCPHAVGECFLRQLALTLLSMSTAMAISGVKNEAPEKVSCCPE